MSFSQLFWLIPNFKPVNPLFTNLYKPQIFFCGELTLRISAVFVFLNIVPETTQSGTEINMKKNYSEKLDNLEISQQKC